MSKRVIFRIDSGNFEQGFSVTLTIKENGEVCAPEVKGRLTPAPEIIELYHQWQEAYNSWGQNYRGWRRKIDVPPEIERNYRSYSEDDLKEYARQFEAALNKWLDGSQLQELRKELKHTVNKKDAASFIFQTDCKELQKLPWELWSLLKNNYNTEVALSQRSVPKKGTWKSSLKILVILGSDNNIDVKTDWKIIQDRLQKDELVPLEQPSQDDVIRTLEVWPWDIVCFAGHSSTDRDGNDAKIWLNDQEYLSPQQLKDSLKKAVKNGLKLVIFNSCDGLGLARQLESLQLPHSIVMREPVHDQVAQKFLDNFLKSFTSGAALHEAVWKARNELKEIEESSPNASWLPVIFQNPEEPPLFYRRKNDRRLLKLVLCGMGAIASLTLTASIPLLPPQQKACDAQLNKNLPLSCGEKALMNPKSSPPQVKKEEGINAIAQHNYQKAVELLTQAWQEKKDPETLIYLNNAKILADNIPEHQIYTIPVVVPISKAPDFQSKDIVKGIAWLQDRVNKNPRSQSKIIVMIADDGNNMAQAQTIAKELAKRSDTLVVIGHYSSHLTTNVKNIYQRNKLVLVSPSAAASQGLSSTDPVNNFFFRATPNTQLVGKELADYLNAKNYQNIAIFYTKGKAYSESFKKEFKTHLDRRVKIVGDFDLGEDTSQVKSKVARVKTEFKNVALVILPDAYTISNEQDNQLAVIKENNGELLIAGNETVREDKVLALGRQALRKMVAATPLYPSSSNNKQFQYFWGKAEKPNWPTILSYDALQMAISAIERQPGKPNRIGVQKALANPGFTIQGLSGRITLNGSDRRENTSTLIEPDCSSDYCYWRTIQK
jgi:branched-chain amino acid transport system substrate-binding protein